MVTHRVTRKDTPIQLNAIRVMEIIVTNHIQMSMTLRVNSVGGRQPVIVSVISLTNQPSSWSSMCSFCYNLFSQAVKIHVR